MPCWYYDKRELKNTPSIQDGIDYLTEYRYRRQGARFIMDCGTKLGLRYDTMATGVVYFHRFYMFHSFRDFPRYVTACCCLFLAGKVEETPKKCKQIIQTARVILNDEKFAQFGKNPKEEVMTLERVLLQTIKFDLQVSHPYSFLIKYAKSLKGDNKKIESMVQMAWTFVNDSLCTTLSLQWEPEIIAIALLHLASKLSKFEIMDWYGRTSKQGRWWDMLVEDISLELLEDICHQVLDLYASENQTTGNSPSPPPPPLSTHTSKKNSRSSSPLQGAVKVKKEVKKEMEKPKLDVLPPLTLEATHIPQPFPYAYPGPNPFQQYPPPPNTAFPPPPPPHQYGSYPQYPPVPNQPPPSVAKPYYPPPPPPHTYPPPTPSPQILPNKYYPPPPVP